MNSQTNDHFVGALHSNRGGKSPYKPRLNQLLSSLCLDVSYERGRGNFLYYRERNGKEIEVLDLVGGFGSLLLGHAHPALVEEAQRILQQGRSNHTQGSRRDYAAALAAELSCRSGGSYCVLFGNSGAEAVEAAMKHAMLETGATTFISLERAFHGKTLGAVHLTDNRCFREPFDRFGSRVIRIPGNSLPHLEAAFAEAENVAGFIFEPIQGEGGIHILEREFLLRARQLCVERRVPFIADECHAGLGRTGSFLACQQAGLRPDYLILSKSLGGGLAKISALLVSLERYQDEFEMKHTSTFADDDFSCAIALKTLELIDNRLLCQCRESGARLLAGLKRLAAEFPSVIADVRGRGLLLGIEFRRPETSRSFLLRFFGSQEDLVWVLAGYLLNVHQIRIAPTLSDPFSLRLEPSAFLGNEEIQKVLLALKDVCERLNSHDAAGLTRFLSRNQHKGISEQEFVRKDSKVVVYDKKRCLEKCFRRSAFKVAWLCHFVDSSDLVSLEPSFSGQTVEEIEDYLKRLISRMAPILMSHVSVRSTTGARTDFCPILLPVTSRWMKDRLDQKLLETPRALIQQGLGLAQSLNCGMSVLGQYTSILTWNGTRLNKGGIGISSGNSYSVALALQALDRAHQETGTVARESVLVIVGAAGNMGRICAELLASRYRKTILIGSSRPGAQARLHELSQNLPNASPTTDLSAVEQGNVVLAALNAVDGPLTAEIFGPDAIICDLSVPTAIHCNVSSLRPDLLIIRGGIASLPFGEDLKIAGFPLPAGQVYGCMAEALLLGFEGVTDSHFTGLLKREHVSTLSAMASKHGFGLANYKHSCVLSAQPEEEIHAHTP